MEKIKSLKKKLKKYYNNIKLHFSSTVYVSFGENCLADDILGRHQLKSFSTPYSAAATTVEYILQIENDNFKDFLNLNYLQYEKRKSGGPNDGKRVPRLKKYNALRNRYMPSRENGFEFTHHDVIKSLTIRDTFRRRIARMQKLKGRKRFIIFYHHRINDRVNIDMLLEDLQELKEKYSTEQVKSEVVCFTQKIVSTKKERKLNYKLRINVHFFLFNSLQPWTAGHDFWARKDKDLIQKMIMQIKKI